MENMDKFFDTRKHKPKKGQILASFMSPAEFVEGRGKKDIIDLLKKDKIYQAVQLMKKAHNVVEPDCYSVCREMLQDLLEMTEDEVEKKVYPMIVNYTYYTEKENVPVNDPRWSILPVMAYDKETKTFKSKNMF